MSLTVRWPRVQVLGLALALCVGAAGCETCGKEECCTQMPRELQKVTMPEYVIEAPDILLIDAIRLVPLPPYKIEPLDALLIQAAKPLPTDPLAGLYPVDPEGTVNLGPRYGAVRVVGLTLEQAKAAIEKHLKPILTDPTVAVEVGQSRAQQQVRGEHLVRQDGTVGLGIYGSVRVAGLTLAQAKSTIEGQLAQFLQSPEVSVDVLAYNSKVYYVILDGAGTGQQVVRLPITGNETVLDAISQVNGLGPVSSKRHIWVSRPSPACSGQDQVLPVDWIGITTLGRTGTNYQILPGDRVYVQADKLVTADTYLARVLTPLERVFGFILLGSGVVKDLQTYPPVNTGVFP